MSTAMQAKLFGEDEKAQTEEKTWNDKVEKIKEEIHDAENNLEKCRFCGEKGPYPAEVFFFNGGALYGSNFYAHEECYTKDVTKHHGYMPRGYKILSETEWLIFSLTTGVEVINPKLCEIIFGCFGNALFPRSVRVRYEHKRKDEYQNHVYGVTRWCVEALREHGYGDYELEEA